MAGKPKKQIIYNRKLLDGNDNKGNRYHVTYEQSYRRGLGGYIIRKNSTQKVKCFPGAENSVALAQAAMLFEELVGTDKVVTVPQHEIQLKPVKTSKIIWINIFESDEFIIDKLSDFYDEWNPLETEEGEEPITIKDLLNSDNKYDLQLIYDWWSILDARNIIKEEDAEYEPVLSSHRGTYNSNGIEFFVVFNLEKNKSLILQKLCDYFNVLSNFLHKLTKEELEEELFSIGDVKKDSKAEAQEYWGEGNYVEISDEELNEYYNHPIYKTDGQNISSNVNSINKFFIMDQFMILLNENPSEVANYTKVPAFANLSEYNALPKPKKRIALDSVLSVYLNRTVKAPSEKSKKDADKFWQQFIKLCEKKAGRKLKYIDEVESEYVKYYSDELYKVATDKDYMEKCKWLTAFQKSKFRINERYPKAVWQRHRVGMIKHLLLNAKSEITHDPKEHWQERQDLQMVYEMVHNIPLIKKRKPLPSAMSVVNFKKLLKVADTKWKAILYLSINCGFTLIDIENLRKQDINLDQAELAKYREKEDTVRFAKLHEKTVLALNLYMKEHPNNSDYVFLNEDGSNAKATNLRDEFSALRIEAKVDKNAYFKNIRKATASTAAKGKGISELQVKLLMGHSVNILSHYIENGIEFVTPACNEVCKTYIH